MPLPYDKYSWNFTQHAIGLKPKNLFPLLSAASLFENQSGFGSKINDILISQDVLTSNIRDGKPDAWRDYQQILSETGLIYSTKILRNLRLTEAGRLLLQGELGFSELMSIQSLRYQYPNGLKSAFLTQQIESNVLIKPGVLLLRLLIELFKNGLQPNISVDQCQCFVLPVTQNQNWPEAYDKIKNNESADPDINRHARRNIQDWFKFLNTTDIFSLNSNGRTVNLSLSQKVVENLQLYDSLCAVSEDPSTFWLPIDDSNEVLMTWFKHFGHIPTEFYAVLESNIDEDFINENYISSPTDDVEDTIKAIKNISLAEIGKEGISTDHIIDFEKAKEIINTGYIKRREKTKLHDEMVNVLAKHYYSRGYAVYEDKNSIDLLVRSPKDEISIFEVKTATPRNIYQRTRLAVGQVLEYGYRYSEEFGEFPTKNIVLNLNMEKQPWLQNYMNNHLDIGLVSVLGNDLKSFPQKDL